MHACPRVCQPDLLGRSVQGQARLSLRRLLLALVHNQSRKALAAAGPLGHIPEGAVVRESWMIKSSLPLQGANDNGGAALQCPSLEPGVVWKLWKDPKRDLQCGIAVSQN